MKPANPLEPAIDMIKHWEGCVLHAYQDSVGVWTIGYGSTSGVHKGMIITLAQAEAMMMKDVDTCAAKVRDLVKVPMTANELCALISFSYNVGLGALGKSTLLRKFNSGAPLADVANEFMKWTKAGGRVLPGLVSRRREERALFLSGQGAQIQEEVEGPAVS